MKPPDTPVKPGLERRVHLRPAFDARAQNRGVGGVGIIFVLKGERGAVTWLLLTPWMLPEVEQWHVELGRKNPCLLQAYSNATADALRFHSPVELPGLVASGEPCNWLHLDRCWTGMGSFLHGDEIYLRLKRDGAAGIWDELEKFYESIVSTASGVAPAASPADPGVHELPEGV